MRSSLSLCIFHTSDALYCSLLQYLRGNSPNEAAGERYNITHFSSRQSLLDFIGQETNHIDCLILQEAPDLLSLFNELQQRDAIFPTVIVQPDPGSLPFTSDSSNNSSSSTVSNNATDTSVDALSLSDAYHSTTLRLPADQFSQLGSTIDQAINKFIQLSPHPTDLQSTDNSVELFNVQRSSSLKARQVRLSEKLKERLGYLGVYYKRNSQNFLRHMTPFEREELLRQLRQEYREIILTYFSDETDLNRKLDNFVNVAFFADVPVSQIVEIHMNLMDEFSKQLRLEGRSDEILQDYRLTLIDTIAHLCEMYRRSIPRES